MNDAIQKLLNEYDRKIADCDSLIAHYTAKKGEARKNSETQAFDEVVCELAKLEAVRQAYIQAKADIDSLLNAL